MSAAESRRQLGAAAALSVAEAAALLPVRDATARSWLRQRGLVRDVAQLGEVVVWGDVLDALRGAGPLDDPKPERRATLRRAGVQPRRG